MSDDSILGGDQTPPNTTTQTQTPPPANVEVPEFLKGVEGLDTSVLTDPSLKPIKDINGLIKSYINAQKMVGQDKIIIPKKESPKEEWDNIFQKLGKPASLDQYALTKPEKSVYDDAFTDAFKQKAFELNILPHQAQELLNSINAKEVADNELFMQQAKDRYAKSVSDLKAEYGQAFESKIGMANEAVEKIGGADLKKYLKESGLGNDMNIVKAFVKVAEMLNQEDPAAPRTNKTTGLPTPAEAKQKYLDIMNDRSHPYHDMGKAGHKEAVDSVHKLFAAMQVRRDN